MEVEIKTEARDDQLDDLLRHYHEQLESMQESYRKAAQPIVDRILKIQNMRQPRMIIDAETYARLQANWPPLSEADAERLRAITTR